MRASRLRLSPNDGNDTRSLQYWLGYRNIQYTVRYTRLSANAVQGFLAGVIALPCLVGGDIGEASV
jgi:hypothetical protein